MRSEPALNLFLSCVPNQFRTLSTLPVLLVAGMFKAIRTELAKPYCRIVPDQVSAGNWFAITFQHPELVLALLIRRVRSAVEVNDGLRTPDNPHGMILIHYPSPFSVGMPIVYTHTVDYSCRLTRS